MLILEYHVTDHSLLQVLSEMGVVREEAEVTLLSWSSQILRHLRLEVCCKG